MRLKLISNGTSLSTKVVNAETGEPLEGIESIQWEVDARYDGISRMTLNFVNMPVEIEYDYTLIGVAPPDIATFGKPRKFQLEEE